MAVSTVWLEVVRVVLGVLILLALSTLYKAFKNTKVINELNLIVFGFVLYTFQAAIGAYHSAGNDIPVVWKSLLLDEFIEACMFIVFAIAVVRIKAVFDYLQIEDKLFKALKNILG
ncbi:MAG: hypothetical protein V1835_05240 [Candidatus Micrarchaeota archaeon]